MIFLVTTTSNYVSLHPGDFGYCVFTLLVLLKTIKNWLTTAFVLNVVVTVAVVNQLYQVQRKWYKLRLEIMI